MKRRKVYDGTYGDKRDAAKETEDNDNVATAVKDEEWYLTLQRQVCLIDDLVWIVSLVRFSER